MFLKIFNTFVFWEFKLFACSAYLAICCWNQFSFFFFFLHCSIWTFYNMPVYISFEMFLSIKLKIVFKHSVELFIYIHTSFGFLKCALNCFDVKKQNTFRYVYKFFFCFLLVFIFVSSVTCIIFKCLFNQVSSY